MKYNMITGQVSATVPAGTYEGIDYHGAPPDDVAARAGWVDVTPEIQAVIDAKAAQDAADAAAAEAAQAAALLALESELDNAERITKGLALTILDELNRVATRIRAFDAAVQAAGTLADLKTRVAALSAIPDRTAAQLKAAVKAKVEDL